MKKLSITILVGLCIALAISCKKRKQVKLQPELPAVTSEGRNTFGFMFGKDVWKPNVFSTSYPTLSATYDLPLGGSILVLNVVCRRKSTRNAGTTDTFYLKYINSNISIGNFPLNSTTCQITAVVTIEDGTRREYQLENGGTITFSRWDLTNRIGSGTFSFNTREKTTGEIVAVTDGRFDLKL